MNHRRRPLSAVTLGLAVVLAVGGCVHGPDTQKMRQDIQEKLDKQVKSGLFEVMSFRRSGSSPLPDSESGAQRRIVYFNASLRFHEDYAFGAWEKLSPASLAYTLGAKEKGLFGIQNENRAGDVLYVYGSNAYERAGEQWKEMAAVPMGTTSVPVIGNTSPPIRSKQLIDRLAGMVNVPPPGVSAQEDDVIAEELGRAAENIEHRIERRKHIYSVASGPRGSPYFIFATMLVQAVQQRSQKVRVRALETDGSVENARMLSRGTADYALLQSNVANYAVAGQGPFAGIGPMPSIRSVASLFPELVHVVVKASSPIQTISDLRGKRVNIGIKESGSRYDAEALLAANGINAHNLERITMEGPEEAMDQLRKGKLDAFFITTAAPLPALQEFAANTAIRLLPVHLALIDKAEINYPGLFKVTMAANTYPGQHEAIETVGVAALLVTTSEAPDVEVERVLDLIFSQPKFASLESAESIKISKNTALQNISIPMHPGASAYFGARTRPR